jgi:hypothetical protein
MLVLQSTIHVYIIIILLSVVCLSEKLARVTHAGQPRKEWIVKMLRFRRWIRNLSSCRAFDDYLTIIMSSIWRLYAKPLFSAGETGFIWPVHTGFGRFSHPVSPATGFYIYIHRCELYGRWDMVYFVVYFILSHRPKPIHKKNSRWDMGNLRWDMNCIDRETRCCWMMHTGKTRWDMIIWAVHVCKTIVFGGETWTV